MCPEKKNCAKHIPLDVEARNEQIDIFGYAKGRSVKNLAEVSGKVVAVL